MYAALEQLKCGRILPLVRLDTVSAAIPLAEALMDGGIFSMAVTIRSAACLEGVSSIKRKYPDFLVGIADLKNQLQAQLAVDAGADFLLSPIMSQELLAFSKEKQIPAIIGCCTPSEIAMALAGGAELLNFFPAAALGGVSALTAFSGPFDEAEFLVTNGVNESNIEEYFRCKKVKICGVKWIASVDLVNSEQFRRISELSAALVSRIRTLNIQ